MGKNLKISKERNEGITLIALIVTIIVLIILAGISINLLLGENGLITRAKNAKLVMDEARANELVEIAIANSCIENLDFHVDKNKLERDLKNEFGEENASVIQRDNLYVITLNNGEYTYLINENGEKTTRNISVIWMDSYGNVPWEDTYDNNVILDDINIDYVCSKTGSTFKEYVMPDGSPVTKEKIYQYIKDVNNVENLVLNPTFDLLQGYYTVYIKNKVKDVDYQIKLDGVVQETDTFLVSDIVKIECLDEDFSYWEYGGKVASYENEMQVTYQLNCDKITYATNVDLNGADKVTCILEELVPFVDGNVHKVRGICLINVPNSTYYKEKGILYSKSSEKESFMVLDGVGDDYKRWNSNKTTTPLNLTLNITVISDDDVVTVRPFLVYYDGDGVEKTIYGEQAYASWNSLNNGEDWNVFIE